MDPTNPSQDLLLFLVLPLAAISLVLIIKNWHATWDENLTQEDRNNLLRFAMFILMPVVVFLHECGHAVATVLCGGTVAEFHYGMLWGYVVPNGIFSPEQILIIFLAGNVVEILCGLVCLLLAAIVTSPPLVACLVYLGLYSIAGTTIFYAIISVVNMYGDWTAIYNTTVTSWIPYIATTHAFLVILVIYLCLGSAPKLWFARKTDKEWESRWSKYKAKAEADPTSVNYLDLAWLYYGQSLNSLARKSLEKTFQLEPENKDAVYLDGWLCISERKEQQAKSRFLALANDLDAQPNLRARALIAAGQIEESKIRTAPNSGPVPKELLSNALELYTAASITDPESADAKFYKARVLNKVGLYAAALVELHETGDAKWSNRSLPDMVQVEHDLAIERMNSIK